MSPDIDGGYCLHLLSSTSMNYMFKEGIFCHKCMYLLIMAVPYYGFSCWVVCFGGVGADVKDGGDGVVRSVRVFLRVALLGRLPVRGVGAVLSSRWRAGGSRTVCFLWGGLYPGVVWWGSF